jgi:hypothetical protein
VIGAALMVAKIATGEIEDRETESTPAAELGRVSSNNHPKPVQRGFPRPRPPALRDGGVLVLANDPPPNARAVLFVGNQTNGARVYLFSAEREGGGNVGSAPCAILPPQPTGSTTGFVGV